MKILKFSTIILAILFFFSCDTQIGNNRYAIIYGVNDNLIAPELDAVIVNTLLESKGYQTILRLNTDATEANLISDFQKVSQLVSENDTFFFFWAGHGLLTTDKNADELTYFDLFNPSLFGSYSEEELADFSKVWLALAGTSSGGALVSYADLDLGVDSYELNELMASIQTFKKLAYLDSCHSGGMVDTNSTIHNAIPDSYSYQQEKIVSELYEKSFSAYWTSSDETEISPTKYLTAAGRLELSYEDNPFSPIPLGWNQGFSTYAFIKTPSAADYDSNGYITVTEAFRYIDWHTDNLYLNFPVENQNEKHVLIDGMLVYRPYRPHLSNPNIDFILFEAD